MRNEIMDFLDAQDLGSYTLSQNLPFDTTGVPMYLKNPKSIYVDQDQLSTEVFIAVIGTDSIDMEVTSVTIYFANDAKQLPTDYSSTVETIKSAKALYATNGFFKREVNTQTEFENDLMTTIVELRYYKLLT